MSTFKIAESLKGLSVIILAWAVTGLAAEGVFRLNGDRTTEDPQGLYTQFINGSYKHRPMMNLRAHYASGPFSIHTDEFGFRCDAERKYGLHRDTEVDFLFIGDSQGFGNGVDFEDTIPGHMAALAADRGLRVANSSVGGHGLGNQLELVDWLQTEQRIKVRHYVLLLTPLRISACDSFARVSVGPDGRLYDKPKSSLQRALIWVKSHVVAYTRLRDAARTLHIGTSSTAASSVFAFYDDRVDKAQAVDKLASCLNVFHNYALKNDAFLSIVYVPSTLELDFDALRQAAKVQGLSLNPDLPFTLCDQAATKLGVTMINLRPALEEIQARGGRLHLEGDFHYDAETSRACAELLWKDTLQSIEGLTSAKLQ